MRSVPSSFSHVLNWNAPLSLDPCLEAHLAALGAATSQHVVHMETDAPVQLHDAVVEPVA